MLLEVDKLRTEASWLFHKMFDQVALELLSILFLFQVRKIDLKYRKTRYALEKRFNVLCVMVKVKLNVKFLPVNHLWQADM